MTSDAFQPSRMPNEGAQEVADPEIQLQAEHLRTTLLFRAAGKTQLVSVFNATLLAYVNATLHIPKDIALAWWLIMVLAASARMLLAHRFLEKHPGPATSRLWQRRYAVSTAMVGSVWGVGTILFMWHAPVAAYLFTGLVLSGMVAGAVPILGPVPLVFKAFALPILVPMAIVILVQAGTPLDWAFGAMTIAFLYVVLQGAQRVFETLNEATHLRLEHVGLIQSLEQARNSAEQALAERGKLEDAIKRERDFAESLIDTAQVIVLVLDLEGRIVRFNRYMEELTGYRLAEVQGANWFELALPEDDRPVMLALFKKALTNIPTRANVNQILAKDGRKVRIEWYDKTLRDSRGEVFGLLAIGQDVTQREELAEQQRLLKSAVEQSNSSIVVTDHDARIIYVNKAFTHTTGYSVDEAIGKNPRILKSGLMPAETYTELWQALAHGMGWSGELLNRKKDGDFYWEMANISPVCDQHGQVTHYLAVKDDITLRKQKEAEVARLSQWNELLLNSAGEGIYGVNLEGLCTFINPSALSILGFGKDEILGMNQHDLFHHHREDGSPYPVEECPIYLSLHDGIKREVEETFIRKNGEKFPVQMSVSPMLDNGQLVGAEVIFQDISRRKAMESELLHLATTDALTGVANRRRFLEQLEVELARVKRFDNPAAFLMLDIDHFKGVNDTYGHALGDRVLQHLAELSRLRLRSTDLFGRLGGEEFGILLPGTHRAGARQFADHFRHLVWETPVQSDKGAIPLTISIGVTDISPHDTTPDSILARADAALYRAKNEGRNRVEIG